MIVDPEIVNNMFCELQSRVKELEQYRERDRAHIDRLETSLHEIDREYLKLRSVLIRISNGTDIDPVETAEKALQGKI